MRNNLQKHKSNQWQIFMKGFKLPAKFWGYRWSHKNVITLAVQRLGHIVEFVIQFFLLSLTITIPLHEQKPNIAY